MIGGRCGRRSTETADQAPADLVDIVARAEFSQYQTWVAAYVSQIGKLGEILQVLRGRKHVMFFTTGFEDRVLTGKSLEALAASRASLETALPGDALAGIDPEETFGSAEVRAALDAAIQELRGADTLLHMIDVAGVGGGREDQLSSGMRSDSFESTASGRSSLTAWAEGTGGSVVWNTNRIGDALADIERGTRQFYVVVIQRRADDPAELELQVQVGRRGVRVIAAPSRFAPPPAYADMDEQQRQAQLAELVTKGVDEAGLEFDVLAVPFPGRNEIARVPLVVEVPWEQLERIAKARGDDRVALDLIGYVITATGTMIDLTDRHVELDLKRLREGRLRGLPLRMYDLLWAWPGEHSIRVVLRDEKVGFTSASTRPIRIPGAGDGTLSVGTPVLLDAAHPGLLMRTFDAANPPAHKADGPVAYPFVVGDQELTPMARPEVEAGAPWELMVVVANLTRHPFTGQTQPVVELEIEQAGGTRTPLPSVTVAGQQADESGTALSLWLRVTDPGDVRPGLCRLAVSVTDGISGAVAANTVELWVR